MTPSTPRTVRQTVLSLAVVSSFALLAAGQAGAVVVYNDTYTLQSTGQSALPSGAWSFDTGFQGGKWGAFNRNGHGDDPDSFGVNAITGSADTVIIPRVCFGILGCTPEVTADTRTGASATAQVSGRVGVDANVGGTGSTVSVTLPFTTQMSISNPTTDGKGHLSTWGSVSTSSALGSGAAITAIGTTFSAGVAGVINIDNRISATGCFIGAGCSTSSSDVNLNPGKFSIAGFNTADSHPFSAFGENLPVGSYNSDIDLRAGSKIPGIQGPLLGRLNVSQVSNLSGGAFNSGVLSLSGDQRVASVTADLTGIAQKVLDAPTDVLNPSYSLGVASVDGTLLDAQVGVDIGLQQSYAIDPKQQVTLQFDRPVTWLANEIVIPEVSYPDPFCFVGNCSSIILSPAVYGMVPRTGTSMTLNVGEDTGFYYTDGSIGNLLSRTYSVASNDFTTNESVTLDETMPIEAGCFDLEIAYIGKGTGRQCAYDNTFDLANQAFNVASNEFSLAGFNTFAVDSAPLDSVQPGSVPEPATILLSSIGLAGIAFARRRTIRPTKATSSGFWGRTDFVLN